VCRRLLGQGHAVEDALTGGFHWALWVCGLLGLTAVPLAAATQRDGLPATSLLSVRATYRRFRPRRSVTLRLTALYGMVAFRPLACLPQDPVDLILGDSAMMSP
jgi:hypothetical protein